MSKKTPFFTFPYVTTPPQPRGTAALPWGGAHDDVQHCSDHNKLTAPKMELFSLNSSVHEIFHRAGKVQFYYRFNDWIYDTAESCCPVCTIPPCSAFYTSIRSHVDSLGFWGFFFASLVVWRFFLSYCLAQSGLKFDCISLCTH